MAMVRLAACYCVNIHMCCLAWEAALPTCHQAGHPLPQVGRTSTWVSTTCPLTKDTTSRMRRLPLISLEMSSSGRMLGDWLAGRNLIISGPARTCGGQKGVGIRVLV